MLVTLSEAKGLARRTQRSFASLRMTGRTACKSALGKSYLQMSMIGTTRLVARWKICYDRRGEESVEWVACQLL